MTREEEEMIQKMFGAKAQADKELTQKIDQALWNGRLDKAIDMQQAKLAAQMQNQGANMAGGGLIGGAIAGAAVTGIGGMQQQVVPVPRAELEEVLLSLRRGMRLLDDKMIAIDRKVERLSGFYHWVTEVHPELAAQYKAMRDLYDAANRPEAEGEVQGGV